MVGTRPAVPPVQVTPGGHTSQTGLDTRRLPHPPATPLGGLILAERAHPLQFPCPGASGGHKMGLKPADLIDVSMLDAAQQTKIEASLGHTFKDPALLERALTHSSTAETGSDHNERLEFLGDAVLSIIVCDMLFRMYPGLREGEMTKIKSLVVSRETCADIAKSMGLEKLLILGKGMASARNLPPSLAACALESVIGAIYIDGGFESAERFVRPLVLPLITNAADSGHQQNFKSVLQQWAQQNGGGKAAAPQYKVLDEQGPDHAKCFKVCVEIGGRRFEACWGATKKKAEQDAALIALRELGLAQGHGADLRIVADAPSK